MVVGLGMGVIIALLILIVLLLVASQIRVDGKHSWLVMLVIIVGAMIWLFSR